MDVPRASSAQSIRVPMPFAGIHGEPLETHTAQRRRPLCSALRYAHVAGIGEKVEKASRRPSHGEVLAEALDTLQERQGSSLGKQKASPKQVERYHPISAHQKYVQSQNWPQSGIHSTPPCKKPKHVSHVVSASSTIGSKIRSCKMVCATSTNSLEK